MIVIDASLALKWFVDEELSSEAAEVRVTHLRQIIVPDLFVVEVTGALVRRGNMAKQRRKDAEEAIGAFFALLDEGLIETARATPAAVNKAARLALDLGHPLKDCVYLALAQDLKCDLVTCDAKFAEKARSCWPKVVKLGSASP